MTQRSASGVKIFAFGMITGLFITIFLFCLIGGLLLRNGVTIPVKKEQMVEEITVQASTVMKIAIPEMLTQVREQMPLTVKEQVRSGLGEMSLEIANYQVKLPATVVNRIDGYLQSTVAAAFGELLNGLEAAAGQAITVDQMRFQAARWAESLHGKRFDVVVVGMMRMPVTIRLE